MTREVALFTRQLLPLQHGTVAAANLQVSYGCILIVRAWEISVPDLSRESII